MPGKAACGRCRSGGSCGRRSPETPARSRTWSPLASVVAAMAQFVFESDLHSLLQLDAPIPNAPVARWQRKAKETKGPAPSPMRAANRSHSAGRTPGRTPGELGVGGGRDSVAVSRPSSSLQGPRQTSSLSLAQANRIPRFRPPLANLEVTAISPIAVLPKWRWPASS